RRMSSPREFENLSDEMTKIGKRISGSTLKRIWGYNRDVTEKYSPYRYTLNSLVNLLGYEDFEDFTQHYIDDIAIQCAEFKGETIRTEDIMPGSIVEIQWTPDRQCSLVCLEKGVFKVVESYHGRLRPGDIVRCLSFTQNAPLYFNEVLRLGTNEKFVYTVGLQTGIRYNIHGIINSYGECVVS
ncbi:MAG: hypothetical protein K2H49_00510, partial [Muribaculaceae bacterium]|nr:hypothetical protein [Muribaculaceae bacterium]